MSILRCAGRVLDLSRPRIMGVVNVTPDSFSDGGRYFDRERALEHARRLVADGADIIDIGGESTRPGAAPVDEAAEIDRVEAIVGALAADGTLVSIDTMKPAVMRAAVAAGASMINDVRALQEPGAIEAAATSDAAVCLMHMRGSPRTMQQDTHYDDVVGEVVTFLASRAKACEAAGIARDRLALDPGFGFAKTAAQSFRLLNALSSVVALGYPVVAGFSRKSALGKVTGREPGERLAASIAAALGAVARGAAIVRVHDVRETVDALNVWHAIESAGRDA
jgi:dihydropteroate synthase